MQNERESELYKKLENLEETCCQCKKTQRQLEQLEDDALWMNRRSKEFNDDLFEGYKQDKEFCRILERDDELLEKQISAERNFFQDCRENLQKIKTDAEKQMDECREEISKLKEEG